MKREKEGVRNEERERRVQCVCIYICKYVSVCVYICLCVMFPSVFRERKRV